MPPPPPYGAEAKPADKFAYAPQPSLAASTASAYSAAPGTSPLYSHGPSGVPLLQPFLNPFSMAASGGGSGAAAAAPVAAAPLLPSLVSSAQLSLGQPHSPPQQSQTTTSQQFFPIPTPAAGTSIAPQPQPQLLSQQQLQQLQIQLQLQQLQQQQQQIQQLQQQQQQQQQQYAALQQRLAGNSQAIMLVPIGVDQTGAPQFLPQLHHPVFPAAAALGGGTGFAFPPECPMSRGGVNAFHSLGAAGGALISPGVVAPTPPPLAALPAHAAAAAAAQFHGATPNGSVASYRNTAGFSHGNAGTAAAPSGIQRCPVAHDSAARAAAHNHRSSLRQRRRQALIADYEKLDSAATAAGAGDPNFFVPLTGDVHRQALQRRKQVLFGRATRGYIHYLLAVPPTWRQRAAPAVPDTAAASGGCPFRHGAGGEDQIPSLDLSASVSVTGRPAAAPAHPRTPRSDLRCSKRSWDAVVGRWRAQLRQWDNPLFAADAVGTALKAFGVEPPGLTPVRDPPQAAAGATATTGAAPTVAPRVSGCPVLAAINEAEKAESVRSGGSTPSLSAGSHVSRATLLGGPAHPMFPAAYVRRLYPHVVHFLREVQRLFPPRAEGPEGEAAPTRTRRGGGGGGDESSEDEEESMSQSSVSAAPPQQRVSLLPADIEALFAALGRVEEPDDADDERIVAKHRAVENLMEELSRAVIDASSALTEP